MAMDPEERRRRKAEYQRRYYRENRERYAEYDRQRRAEKSAEHREYHRAYYQANKARWRRSQWAKKYGLTPDDYDRMLAEQGGACLICALTPEAAHSDGALLHVDHCHRTGAVRGLLCRHCNLAIGQLRDDPARLARALTYLAGA